MGLAAYWMMATSVATLSTLPLLSIKDTEPAGLNRRHRFPSNRHLFKPKSGSNMRHLPHLMLAATLFLGTSAQAQTLVATSNIIVRALDRSLDFTSDTTTSVRDMKMVLAARDDAASFVASQGDIRGASLEAAFATLREQLPEARNASDQQLAEAILAL